MVASGWRNCRLIKSFGGEHVNPFTRTMAHSAEIVLTLPQKPNWANGSIYQSSEGLRFMVTRNDFRDLNHTETLADGTHHVETIEDCMQICADKNGTCISAMFDHGLQSGYSNCYLFDNFPPPAAIDSNYSFVFLEAASAQYQPPPSQPSEKKNWIAGAVIGPTAFCVAVGLVLYWFFVRRRKAKAKNS
jgi:hypothetical protein